MLTNKIASLLLSTPLVYRRGKIVNWFKAREALSPSKSTYVQLKDLPMTEAYRQTFWQMIERDVINEMNHPESTFYLKETVLPQVIRKSEWVLLDLAAAISLITIIWLSYMFLPFLPFFS